MSYHLTLRTGFFKKEPIKMEIIDNILILETASHKNIINIEEILDINVINEYKSPELEIHTKDHNYVLYLSDLSQEQEIYRNLSRFFKERFKL